MIEIIQTLRNRIAEAVERSPFKGLLLGGLDSSILACLNPGAVGITVSLGADADDIPYANLLAGHLNLKHYHRKVEIDEAVETIPALIKILKSFDPALPNDLAVYFGLDTAKELGLGATATGDGSDELFAGYSFMEEMDDLELYIRKISKRMNFSSNRIGGFLGVKIVQPFMDKKVADYALRIPVDLKIRKEKDKSWGKWILRKSFEDLLPKKIVWQEKRPLESGSGMAKLRRIISDRIPDEEFRENKFPVKFMDKEHLYYYKVFREVIGEIPEPAYKEKNCPSCGGGMKQDGFHCGICGYAGEWRIS